MSNPAYKRVKVLHLNYNHINSTTSLEKSDWIKHFNLLSLQGNALNEVDIFWDASYCIVVSCFILGLIYQIPLTALNHAFKHRDINGVRMFLGHNPWRCDCLTVTNYQVLTTRLHYYATQETENNKAICVDYFLSVFPQSFIAKHNQLIKDMSNVTCGPAEGDNAGKKIGLVELSSVCWSPDTNMTNLMDVLSAFLALMTVCTLVKLLYDYNGYRKTGRLPWPVSKMP